jgi:phosphate transport system permease protein
MIPLIFGTIKATFYSMLIGAPLAILAAIYSSEFLHPRVKSAVKPTIELMASLPSVVLGFLAALVFAPFIDSIVPTTLATFLTVPFCFLLGAYLWQLLPNHLAIYLANMGLTVPIPRNTFDRAWNAVQKGIFLLGGVRLICIMLMLIAGVGMAFAIGPFIDQWLFAGDVKRWLNWTPDHPNAAQTRQYASVVGGWTFLLLPFTAIITALLMTWLISPVMRRIGNAMSRGKLAWLDLAKFLGGAAFALGLALGCGLVFNAIGLDPRSEFGIWGIDLSPVDTYVQRNSLIVGVVMGFAIIPIIYTICDDALSAVPEHLRSASLGAGATPWQTAVRIVIPTAMSGMFSAVMIGLGRAVGETMIVLMASGGTPIMDMNIFSGFRTLSQNIANELPEAPKDGTHYLTLFLAALVLFAMTFILNTIAETVRLRFRKRAYQL